MTASESDDLVALSGLQHVVFCERRAALIHVEQLWKEDAATAGGRILHERADLPGITQKEGVRVARAVMLRSDRLGLSGRADVVEYHADTAVSGGWRPYPVEYKRGRVNDLLADQVQVCAQAICLEEAHGCEVPRGAIFHAASHRRTEVVIDAGLRERTARAAAKLHELVRDGVLPRVAFAPKCKRCSLLDVCMPKATHQPHRASAWLARILNAETP